MQFATKEDYLKHLHGIKDITSYIDYFSKDDEVFGEGDTTSFPSIHYTDTVNSFVKALYDNGFIRTDFNWTEWDAGEAIFKNHKLIKSLKFEELQYLLTVIVRKERFYLGFLMSSIKSGMILLILKQLRFLTNPEGDLLYEDMLNSEGIELNEFYITGLEYYDAKELDFSDIDYLSLHLEPNNDYDENAIEIYHQEKKVGYVPKGENSLIAKLMKQDVNVIAKIINYDKEASLQKRIKIKLYQDGMIEVITRESLEQEHIKVFGVEPYVIGMFWNSPESITQGIIDAIESDKPYNEYLMLSVEDRKAFDDGDLVF